MKKQKTPKQLKAEQEAARKEKIIEIDAEYASLVNDWTKEKLEEVFSFPSEEEWKRRKIEEWDSQQPLIISGKYQDRGKIIAERQQKFVEFIRLLCPEVIEELKNFTPLFDKVFGENKNNYVTLFNWRKMDIYHINNSLNTYINGYIPDFPLLEFRPYTNFSKFRYDYKWGENRVLFYFLYWIFEQSNSPRQEEILLETLQLLSANITPQINNPNFPKLDNEDALKHLIQNASLKVFEEFTKDGENSYFVSGAKQYLNETFKKMLPDVEPSIKEFILLQIELMKWAETHNIEKDWLLKYAYDFLKQFSNNPNMKGSEVKVGFLQVRTLAALPFDFKFNGWIAGDEKKEVYENRLRESFESTLELYFQEAGRHFQLEKIKKITKPLDFDNIKPLVRKTVQKWSFEKIVELDYEIQNNHASKKYFSRKLKYLKDQLPKFEAFDLPYKA